MTDQPPIAAARPAGPVAAPVNWTNVIALAIAAVTSLAGLVALRFQAPYVEVSALCGPIVTACCIAYQAGRGS